jgi:hypothetical protein
MDLPAASAPHGLVIPQQGNARDPLPDATSLETPAGLATPAAREGADRSQRVPPGKEVGEVAASSAE